MRFLNSIGVLLCVGGLLVSCDLLGTSEEAEQLAGPTWQLTSLETSDGERYTPDQLVGRNDGDEAYVLRFSEDGNLGGTADCNTYGGPFSAEDGGDLSTGSLWTTDVYCGQESRERLYLELLGGAEEYEVDGNRLRLDANDGGMLAFVRR